LRSDRDFFVFLKSFLRGKRLAFAVLMLAAIAIAAVAGARGEDKSDGLGDSAVEKEITELCSRIDGVGECHVAVVFEDGNEGRVYSVAVVCDGGDSVRVRAAVTELITSLFGIGANRVSVMKLG